MPPACPYCSSTGDHSTDFATNHWRCGDCSKQFLVDRGVARRMLTRSPAGPGIKGLVRGVEVGRHRFASDSARRAKVAELVGR